MSGLVTKQTNRSVPNYIESLQNNSKIADSKELLELMKEVTGSDPKV